MPPRCCGGPTVTGNFPSPGCTSFYYCYKGKDQRFPEIPCQPGLLFDFAMQQCLHPDDVDCPQNPCSILSGPTESPTDAPSGPTDPPTDAPTSSPSETPPRCCPEGHTGGFPSPSCTSFYFCSNGQDAEAPAINCGAGTLFDFNKGRCEMASTVNCPQDVCRGFEPSPSPTVLPTASPTEVPPRCCPNNHNGGFPVPGCKKFYMCSNGMDLGAPEISCGATSLFDVATKTCKPSGQVSCPVDVCNAGRPTPAPTRAPTSRPTKSPVVSSVAVPPPEKCCPSNHRGYHAAEGCRSYYFCDFGTVFANEFQCGPDQLYDNDRKGCFHKDTVQCEVDPCSLGLTAPPTSAPAGNCCPSGLTGLFAADDCSKFYFCENGIDKGYGEINCDSGLLFDVNLLRCEQPEFVTCPKDPCGRLPATAAPTQSPTDAPTRVPIQSPVAAPSPTTAPAISPTDAPSVEPRCCKSGFTGFHPGPTCKTFYYCSNGVDTGGPEQSCDGGLLFSADLGVCDFAQNVVCPPDPCNPPVPTTLPTSAPTATRKCCPDGKSQLLLFF